MKHNARLLVEPRSGQEERVDFLTKPSPRTWSGVQGLLILLDSGSGPTGPGMPGMTICTLFAIYRHPRNVAPTDWVYRDREYYQVRLGFTEWGSGNLEDSQVLIGPDMKNLPSSTTQIHLKAYSRTAHQAHGFRMWNREGFNRPFQDAITCPLRQCA